MFWSTAQFWEKTEKSAIFKAMGTSKNKLKKTGGETFEDQSET